jgi:hypothetical protein
MPKRKGVLKTSNTSQGAEIFISYSHADNNWLKRLRTHLKPLERDDGIKIFSDADIKAGTTWRKEIKQAIESAKVAILLISANFLASDFIATDELPPLLREAEERGTRILPLIVSASRFRRMPQLSEFQAVNNPDKPLVRSSKGDQEAVFERLAEIVEEALGARATSSVKESKGKGHKMTAEDLAWATGMFESRGSILISRSGERFTLRCRLVGIERPILDFFQDRWPGSLVQTRPERGKKVQWVWSVSGNTAAAFLKDLDPMMKLGQSKAKAALAFEFQSLKIGGNYHALQLYTINA